MTAITENTEYDVVIVGAGMAGASLACILQQSLPAKLTLKILLIESLPVLSQETAVQPSFDARSTALSFGTVEYLKRFGLWDKLGVYGELIKKIHVSDQGKFGAVRMDCREQGTAALGYVVENQALGRVLNQAVLSAERIEVCSPAQVLEIKPGAESVGIILEKNSVQCEVTSRLIVLAEGGRSGLCEKLGIHRSDQQYGQTAIIANVAFSDGHANVAYERFTCKGPMALLPLHDYDGSHRAGLVWTQPTEEVDEILALDDKQFLSRLQEAFGSRLGEFIKVGERFSYPLSLQQAEEQIRQGVVLLGNVAHSLHPVAGQGFNLAFRDGMRLAESIVGALECGDSPGSIKVLQAYLDKTEWDQGKTIAFSHYMTGLFSSGNTALVWARKFGLFSVDLLPFVKRELGRQAMGFGDSMVSIDRRF